MAVCVAAQNCKSKLLRIGIYFFAAMEWISDVGYKLFPWVAGADTTHPQNVMHLIVTILVVLFSLGALVLVIIGSKKEEMKSLFIWSCICLASMLLGPIGTGVMPKAVFGLFERFSTFSAVIFNAVRGTFLLIEKFGKDFC